MELFSIFFKEQFFFAIGSSEDAIWRDPFLDKCCAYGIGTIGAKGEVISSRTTFVAVSFDKDIQPWVVFHVVGDILDNPQVLIAFDTAAVKVIVDVFEDRC